MGGIEIAIQSYEDLKVFNLAYDTAMEVFWLTKKFPREELYFHPVK